MTVLATEEGVRTRTQALDTEAVPAGLVAACIGDAHARLAAHAAPGTYSEPAAATAALAETLLAGALLLRSLASRAALERRSVKVGGQSLERGQAYGELTRSAADFEARAWEVFSPHLARAAQDGSAETTSGASVL